MKPSGSREEFKLSLTDSDCYTDSNLDWSFLNLSKTMVRVLAEDHRDLTRKSSAKKVQFNRGSQGTSTSLSKSLLKSSPSTAGVNVSLAADLNESLEDWSFNIFDLNDLTKGHALKFITHEIFRRHCILVKYKINSASFTDFIDEVSRHYKRIPFHNSCHAADVLQTVNCIILNTGFTSLMTELEKFAILITALVHDIEHTGTNNNFHKNSGSEMAKLYMVSVLENHHLRVGMGLLWKFGLLNGLTDSEIEDFQFMLSSMILCTDMVNHFQLLTNMRILLESPAKCSTRIRIRRLMTLILHAADISNPSKPWEIHTIWVALLCEEFFRQGEKEKQMNLPVSPNCDKNTANIATLQIGFIGTFLQETYDVMDKLLEKDITSAGAIYTNYSPWSECIKDNIKMWKGQWRFLKYEFINKLFEQTADPRKSILVKTHHYKQKKKSKWRVCPCCSHRPTELTMFDDLTSTTC